MKHLEQNLKAWIPFKKEIKRPKSVFVILVFGEVKDENFKAC